MRLDPHRVARGRPRRAQLTNLCQKTQRSLYLWDHADYFKTLAGDNDTALKAKDAYSALEIIEKAEGESVFVLRDFHHCWKNQPTVLRKLRNVVQALKYSRKSIIITTPSVKLPEELRDDAVILDAPLPNYEELTAVFDHLAETPGVRVELSNELRDRAIKMALGLSAAQAQRAFAKAIVTDGAFREDDMELITREKREIIRGSGALEYFSADETINDVGGWKFSRNGCSGAC